MALHFRSVPIFAEVLVEIGCYVTLITQESDDMNIHILDAPKLRLHI